MKRSLILDGTDRRETSYIKEETVSTKSIFMGRIFEVINRDKASALGSEKYFKRRTRFSFFAVQGVLVDGF